MNMRSWNAARVIAIVLTLLSATVIVPRRAQAQCQLSVRPTADSLGYRARGGERCEGMYVELQSAPLNLRVVSLLRGGALDTAYDGESVLLISVPSHEQLAAHNLRDSVGIVAQPREAGLNWALDAWARGNARFRWNLDDVFRRTGISLAQVGISGWTRRTDGSPDPVYVPVAVTAPGAIADSDAIHIIFHLPAAGSARVCTVTSRACTDTLTPVRAGGYYDGFFEATLAFGDAPGIGVVPLVVQWRRADGSGETGRDRLDIFRWQ